MGFPGSSAGKETTCSAGDPGSIPGLGWRIPMDRGAWRVSVLGVTESQTRLSDLEHRKNRISVKQSLCQKPHSNATNTPYRGLQRNCVRGVPHQTVTSVPSFQIH